MNKIEQVFSNGHQMSVVGAGRVPCVMSKGAGPGGSYNEVQCIMDNGHMGTPCEQTDTTDNITFL